MVVKNYIQFQQVLSWLDRQTEVAYDLETTGLSPRKDMVIGIALGNQQEGFYVVHQHLENGQYQQYITKKMLEPLWAKLKTKKLITFNGSFDARFTRGYFDQDLAPHIFSEAQLARHTSDENLDAWAGLKKIAAELFGGESTQEQQDLNASITSNGGSPGQVWLGSLDLVGKYAIQDAILTAKVESYFRKSVIDQGLWKFYQDDEVMPLYREVTIDLEWHGVKVDIPVMLQTKAELEADIAILEQQIREKIAPHLELFDAWYLAKSFTPKASGEFAQAACRFYNIELPKTPNGAFSFAAKALDKVGDCLFKRFMAGQERLPDADILAIQRQMRGNQESFNLKSKHHFKKLFFDTFQETPLSYTKETKQPQLDDEFLESVKEKYDFVPSLLDYNKLNKILSTYIERFLAKQQDGRFYPSWQQHTTSTGRYSGDLQQLPRKKDENELSPLALKYTNKIREFFIADENKVLVGADYSSLEVVIFADDAGDEPLLDIIRQDKDFYSEMAITARNLEGYSSDKQATNFLKKHRPDLRQDAKPFSLGIRYGMQEYKLHKELNISKSEAKTIINNYFTRFPLLKSRMDDLKNQANTAGYVKSKFGRICHLEWSKKLYQAYGNKLENSLTLWEKYNETPAKYKEMKFLQSKYLSDIRAALNFPIQSGAGSIVNRASVALARALKVAGIDACICMNVHDEIVLEVNAADVERLLPIMKDKMENTCKLSVPLIAEPQVGYKYADLK